MAKREFSSQELNEELTPEPLWLRPMNICSQTFFRKRSGKEKLSFLVSQVLRKQEHPPTPIMKDEMAVKMDLKSA